MGRSRMNSRIPCRAVTAIEAWIASALAPHCDECWIFGSEVRGLEFLDVDVLLIFDRRLADDVLSRSGGWRAEFNQVFGCDLHLNRLTREEAEEKKEAIKILLEPASKRVSPPLQSGR